MTVLRSRLFASAMGLGLLSAVGTVSLAGAQSSTATVQLAAQNTSGISGTATLTDLGGGKTRVVVNVTGAAGGNEPAHIHEGTCATLNPAPKYPLTNVQNGASTTEVNVSLADLQKSPYAINLHKSPQDVPTYVACGDIVAAGAQAAAPSTLPRTGDLGPSTPVGALLAMAGAAIVGLGFVLRRRFSR